ncbi:hypothetical protein ABTG11_05320 [Acinetobacter baumannii]|uniref:Immunity protein 52 domain-containing protein n=2 Tax=Acinetobacter baumannii TaxID=470 RepID=A0A009T8V9_ACIBA|nr:hypothetical protein [Acinetobacter baumannii]EXC50930.1 hypothetical protein J529_2329 [Acinetobacter baumannii 99063]MBD0475781.1 hypothetical protein [Acinetobacter baumannii]MCG6638840.1 hypothetical protein [Acinetobacter baumannii]MCT9415265.1 hypothetical protein [Acinetobacter baumannii]MCT9504497.1 hypothetical protein [Acinetobacter baumannii]
MSEFVLSTRLPKVLGTSSSDIEIQLKILENIVKEISVIDPIFANWYINNYDETAPKAPLVYTIPSEKGFKYLFDLKSGDEFESFSLWNGIEENINYASIDFSSNGLIMAFEKVLTADQIVQVFEVLLKYIKIEYLFINHEFFRDGNIFEHRLPTSSICYVSLNVAADYLPHLYKKVDIDNGYNKGTILVFDENWISENEDLKKKVQENSIALIEIGAIPEAIIPDSFFE